jgi:hypothetical protein
MQQAVTDANQFRFAQSPQMMAMTMINRGVPPEMAMEGAARIIQQFGGGGRGTAPPLPEDDPTLSEASKRGAAKIMAANLSQRPTMVELLDKRQPEEFDTNDLYSAYQKWIDGKLNESDLAILSQFIRAREKSGNPVQVPEGILWTPSAQAGLRGWLDSLRSGVIDSDTLRSRYQKGYDQNQQMHQQRRDEAMKGIADSILMGGW